MMAHRLLPCEDMSSLRRMVTLFVVTHAISFMACAGNEAPDELELGDAAQIPDAEDRSDSGVPADAADSGDGASDDVGGSDSDGGVADEVRECLMPAVGRSTPTEALELVGEGTSVGVVRYIDPSGIGTSGTKVWIAERLAWARGGESACVTDGDQLDYQGSHHNFQDAVVATQGDLVVTLHLGLELSIEASRSGALLWGPVELTRAACHELTPGPPVCRELWGTSFP